jgi:chloride channel protein, CIC family
VLAGGAAVTTILLAFLLRFVLGAVSYAAATPGLSVCTDARSGSAARRDRRRPLPNGLSRREVDVTAFAVVGMAAFFTGVVQAPVTGIVLVAEMTGGSTMLLPMLAACSAAMLIPNLLHGAPIYESLREHAARRQGSDRRARLS